MRSKLILLAPLGLVAACAPVDHGLGETVEYAKAAQTIDPDPVYDEDGAQPGDNADVAAAAAARYRSGNVEEPQAESTSSGGGGGGL